MIPRLQATSQAVAVQDTTFSVDVMGRYVCNTWDEAVNNGGTRPLKGHVGLQNHHPGSRVQFRNIRIKTL